MNLALTRAQVGYRDRVQEAAPVARRDPGELISKIVIVTLFSAMAMRLAADAVKTGHITGMLLLASEAMVVALTLLRRSAATVDRSWRARLLTGFSTFAPPLVRPAAVAGMPESFTVALTAIGLIIVLLGKISLGRSFGLTPANRGVVCGGVYRFVRHPIYLGYLLTHVGFVIANLSPWNVALLVVADSSLMLRARCEEQTLAADPAYRAYMQRTRWRVVPKVF